MDLGPYGAAHWGAIALTVLLCVFVVRRARSMSKPRDDRLVMWGLRIFALMTILPHHIMKLFYQKRMLLDLCDLAGIAALVHVMRPNRFIAALLLYWGLTLTPNALMTPDFPADAGAVDFFFFFGPHMVVVVVAFFATFGERPVITWKLYAAALFSTLGIVLATFVFNLLFNTNFMYLAAKPRTGSLLDLLGPWPWYILNEALVAAVVWALLTMPFLPGKQGRETACR
jgi:hypothetical integral membrane protein (TIGR02206 family)